MRSAATAKRGLGILALFVLALGAGACRHAEIPYALPSGPLRSPPRHPLPRHPLRLAVLPLVDAQSADEGPDDAEGYVYRGVEYEHTRLDDLEGSPSDRVTELLARHVALAGVFTQLVLVDHAEDAREADLVLSGRIRRLRGYVERRAGSVAGRPDDERFVVAEVFLEGLEVREAKHPERRLLRVDAGWSIHEARRLSSEEVDPWRVLAEALQRAFGQLVSELERADLSGATLALERVELTAPPDPDAATVDGARARPFGRLPEALPTGWIATRTSSASRPLGWKSPVDREGCLALEVAERQGQRFHRALGPYRPAVIVWSCPRSEALRVDSLVEFPALYLGERADGARVFAQALGASSWPTALDDVAAHLAVERPKVRYTFEVEAR